MEIILYSCGLKIQEARELLRISYLQCKVVTRVAHLYLVLELLHLVSTALSDSPNTILLEVAATALSPAPLVSTMMEPLVLIASRAAEVVYHLSLKSIALVVSNAQLMDIK